jgi:hypothetical protein
MMPGAATTAVASTPLVASCLILGGTQHSQGTGHRGQVTGDRSQGTGHRGQVTGTGHRGQVTGTGHRSLP